MRKAIALVLALLMCASVLPLGAMADEEASAPAGEEISAVEEVIETEEPAETEEPTETEEPAETEEPTETEEPAETEKSAETEEPAAVGEEEPVLDGAGSVTINATNFPDANFRSYVSRNCDSDSDGVLSNSEIAKTTWIECTNSGITSLKGIEVFTSLEELYCDSNRLTTLDVSKNTKLWSLACQGNQLKMLDIRNCPELLELVRWAESYNGSEPGMGYSDDFGYILYSDGKGGSWLSYDKTTTLITENLQVKTYTVTFNANGGSCSTSSKSVTNGSTYGTLPTPTKSGSTFSGWYTAKSGGTKITSSSTVNLTSNQTLYAHWTSGTTGWVKSGGYWYYYFNGRMLKGTILLTNGPSYILKSDGKMATGWVKHNGSWYYCSSSGAIQSNTWVKSGGSWYYLQSNGTMAYNTMLTIGGSKYIFKSSGVMVTGWVKFNGSWYYCNTSGAVTKSAWLKSGGYWYYLKSSGRMAVSETLTISGVKYKFDSSGHWVS